MQVIEYGERSELISERDIKKLRGVLKRIHAESNLPAASCGEFARHRGSNGEGLNIVDSSGWPASIADFADEPNARRFPKKQEEDLLKTRKTQASRAHSAA